VHCLLGNEGMPPIELLAKGRKELQAFGHVALREDKVVSIQPKQTQFTVTCASGLTAAARKVLLTTGLQDEVPQIDGIESLAVGAMKKAVSLSTPKRRKVAYQGFTSRAMSRDVLLVTVAIAEGAKAAVAINRALLKDDGLG
jgi:thioredoxin reductase